MTITKTYTPKSRGMMLNGTSVMDAITKIGERALLMGYVKEHKITHLDMYGISGVLQNKSNWAGLAALLKDLRNAGVTQIGAQRGSANTHLEDVNISTVLFNAWSDDAKQRFDILGMEGEPWQPDHTKKGYMPYSEWMANIKKIKTYCDEHSLLNAVYVHDLSDTTTNLPAAKIALDLVQNADIIYKTIYMPASKIISKSSVYKKVMLQLNLLADAAKSIGKQQHLYLLINAKTNTEGSGEFLATHSADEIYSPVINDTKTMVSHIGSLYIPEILVYGWQEMKAFIK